MTDHRFRFTIVTFAAVAFGSAAAPLAHQEPRVLYACVKASGETRLVNASQTCALDEECVQPVEQTDRDEVLTSASEDPGFLHCGASSAFVGRTRASGRRAMVPTWGCPHDAASRRPTTTC
jgi:hypothetical protein